MVAAFLKLGMPTMMSASPSRAIWSRTAGVRAVWGIALTLPLAAGHRPRRPIAGDLARSIARVRALECEAAEALGAPRAHPSIDRRADEDAGADQRVVGEDGF